ncbi:uncharacterized protein METZ01_LOCUS115773 [marine metagenome]|uniref:Uncharacterized protein n=1 Tax=marine metagenome TaxID=408172 RepID=A0A381XDU7_9ZZZZ
MHLLIEGISHLLIIVPTVTSSRYKIKVLNFKTNEMN